MIRNLLNLEKGREICVIKGGNLDNTVVRVCTDKEKLKSVDKTYKKTSLISYYGSMNVVTSISFNCNIHIIHGWAISSCSGV